MGKIILCMGMIAKTPYHLSGLGISIYSIEELCFCIREKTILMDDKLVKRDLVDWIREECKLPELADSLYGFLQTKASASAFFGTILEYVGFYPEEERKRIEQYLKDSANLNEFEKEKNSADYLAGNGRYALAINHYFSLLERIGDEDVLLKGKTLHNLGYVCCQLFLFDRGADYFEKAYQLTGMESSLEQFLAAKRMLLGDKAYIDFIASRIEYYELSMRLEKRIEQLSRFWLECGRKKQLDDIHRERLEDEEGYQLRLEELEEQIKEQYRLAVKE